MPTERQRTMTILDPISGKRVDIDAFGKLSDRCTSVRVDARHAVLPGAGTAKGGRTDPNTAPIRTRDQDMGGSSAG